MSESIPDPKPESGVANSNSLAHAARPPRHSLTIRNIVVGGQRTTIRLETEMWRALHEIADREKCEVNDICSFVHHNRKQGSSLTASIRVFVMLYFKCACTEDGHNSAGHGDFKMLQFNYIRGMRDGK